MRKKQAVTSFFFLLQKQPNICSKHELLTCFSLVSLDSYWDRTLAVSPMCLSASQTLTHKINSASRRRRVFFLSVCRRVSYSHYVSIRRLSKAFVTMATGQWRRHRKSLPSTLHLSLPPHLSLCSAARPHGKAPF